MAERELQGRTLDQLLERFAELVSLADGAPGGEAIVSRDEMGQIENELKARGPDHTNGLMSLAMHSDETVRMEAMAALFRIMTGNPDVDARLVHQVAVATNAPFLKTMSSTRQVEGMPPKKLAALTTAKLVERFVEIGLAQEEANLYDEIDKYNRLFDKMQDVVKELRGREGDQRSALLPLYDHPNLQVRLKAVKNSLALAPEEGRCVLQAIADSKRQPHAFEAGMSLRNLDDGIFNPT